jgi:hypothetical protein
VSQGVVSAGRQRRACRCSTRACCLPIPGDRIVGYLGRGEGLVVHTDDCPGGKRLLARDSERFLEVEWADEPVRAFDTTCGDGHQWQGCAGAGGLGHCRRPRPTSPMSTWATNRPRPPPTSVSRWRCATGAPGGSAAQPQAHASVSRPSAINCEGLKRESCQVSPPERGSSTGQHLQFQHLPPGTASCTSSPTRALSRPAPPARPS